MKPMRRAAQIASRAARKYMRSVCDDAKAIDRATVEAEQKIRELPTRVLRRLLPELITLAIRGLVQDGRKAYNAKLTAFVEGPPAVMRKPYLGAPLVSLAHPSVLETEDLIWLDMVIGNRRLGSLNQEDGRIVAENVEAAGKGMLLKGQLVRLLIAKLKQNQIVQDRWSNLEIAKVWRSLQPKGRPRRWRRSG